MIEHYFFLSYTPSLSLIVHILFFLYLIKLYPDKLVMIFLRQIKVFWHHTKILYYKF